MATFKSGTYVVLMYVAWTALLLATLRRRKVKPYYRRPGSRRFQRIEGRPKVWELTECVRQYWAGRDDAVCQNLRFFAGLRNLIEHADVPQVDLDIFGECQALLLNFEDLLEREFGGKYAIQDSLAISLQFSRIREPTAQQALRQLHRPVPADIKRYIDDFRSGLSSSVLNDMAYSHKVFLVPMVGSHRSKDSLAVEFVHYDPNDPNHDRAVTMIKQKLVPAVNVGCMKPGDVVRRVAEAIAPRRFNMNIHTLAWRHWEVRPPTHAVEPATCKTQYCRYDPVHKDYVYTDDWVDFLAHQRQDDEIYRELIGAPNPLDGV